MQQVNHYFVPENSRWPFIASVSAFVVFFGLANAMHNVTFTILYVGILLTLGVMFLWFRDVVIESRLGV